MAIQLTNRRAQKKQGLKLESGSRIGVIGGGPAGSFFSFFVTELARRLDLKIHIDIYERQNFNRFGPAGCNHCGGIVSESLVQHLATEGINLPSQVVLRGIDSYILHTELGSTPIETPLHEKRIAAMYRGAGPLGTKNPVWESFDGFLQKLVLDKGVDVVQERVDRISLDGGRPRVTTAKGRSEVYDLIVGAAGINTTALKLFENLGFEYQPPKTTSTYLCEFQLGAEKVQQYFGNAMNVFLLDIPRLEFGAIIPKEDFVTVCLLGNAIDKELVQSFLSAPEVVKCFPDEWSPVAKRPCQCFPKINIESAVHPYGDRVVLIGDSASTKLYKNGIGAAYVTAKAAAATAVFHGVSAEDFKRHYWKHCRSINLDNIVGKGIFALARQVQKRRFSKRFILKRVAGEQKNSGGRQHMSTILWDTFTGSASYRNIFFRMINPVFVASLAWEIVMSIFNIKWKVKGFSDSVKEENRSLGRLYSDNEEIFKQGDVGNCMYVIQEGKVEVVMHENGKDVHIAYLGEREFFGEMALFELSKRSATVKAKGEARILSVSRRTLLERIQEDPTLAFRLVEKMSSRMRDLNEMFSRIKASDRRNWDTRPDSIDYEKRGKAKKTSL